MELRSPANMAEDEAPFVAEYAKSGRAGCKLCKGTISKDSLRLAKMVQVSRPCVKWPPTWSANVTRLSLSLSLASVSFFRRETAELVSLQLFLQDLPA